MWPNLAVLDAVLKEFGERKHLPYQQLVTVYPRHEYPNKAYHWEKRCLMQRLVHLAEHPY